VEAAEGVVSWWPFGKRAAPVEKRAEAGGFTSAVVDALMARARGGASVTTAEATAALEAAAGVYARAFAVATVTPATTSTAALTPAVLATAAREVIRRGECVAVIEVDRNGARLVPAGSWTVYGSPDPATWWYRCDLWGPSGNRTVRAPAASVVHFRYSVDPSRPWAGVGPLGWAALTGRLAGALEDALADEAGGTRGHVLPVPKGPEAADDDDAPDDPNADLRRDFQTMKGSTVMVETTAAGWGEGAEAAPRHDWRPSRIGAAPPAPLVDLRSGSVRSVLSACGIPPGLFEAGGDAAGKRECWRILLHGGIQPLADLLAAELAAKLDAPGLRLSFDRLFASDVQGRARAFASMIGRDPAHPLIPVDEARRLSGL
jgi:hypothetical protein